MKETFIRDSIDMVQQQSGMHEAEGNDDVGEVRTSTYRHGSFVNGSKASPANLFQSSVATHCHFLVLRISRPPGSRGRWLFSRHG